jgi:hypothetical protein
VRGKKEEEERKKEKQNERIVCLGMACTLFSCDLLQQFLSIFKPTPCIKRIKTVSEHTARQTFLPLTSLALIWFNHIDHMLPLHQRFRETCCFLLQSISDFYHKDKVLQESDKHLQDYIAA